MNTIRRKPPVGERPGDNRAVEALMRLLLHAKKKDFTGIGYVRIDLSQGGVMNAEACVHTAIRE